MMGLDWIFNVWQMMFILISLTRRCAMRKFVNREKQLCLEHRRDIVAWPCQEGNNFQTWDKRPDGRIINIGDNLCLDSNHAGEVYPLDCNGGQFQNWRRIGPAFQNVATTKCLSTGTPFAPIGADIVTKPCDGSKGQMWDREKGIFGASRKL